MPEKQHTEHISAAASALEAAQPCCYGADYGKSALLIDSYMLRYLHRADGAEYKHILNAPDGPITLDLAQ